VSADGPICRDCLAVSQTEGAARCPACGSPRLLHHAELAQLAIAHVDCDAFYAAVEKRDAPALRDKPLIVGGGKRGVVATCCYIARTFGVRSAMPMFKALAACPQAIVVRPDMAKYARVGREIRALMHELTPLVEPISIDEAFLDLNGTQELHRASPALTLARFAHRVEAEIGVTVSVGLSYCKFLAKLASDLDKPRGFAVIGRAEAQSFLATQPIGVIWGVGRVTQERLAKDGLRRIADLQARGEQGLVARYGGEGRRLWQLAHGEDARRVSPQRETKSISAETTFETDLATEDELEPILYRLCERLALRLKSAGLGTRGITLKLKSADFRLRTRARSGLPPTKLAKRLFVPARELLRAELDGTRFRLIGIGAHDLCAESETDRGDLIDSSLARDKATEAAIDALRARFGESAVVKGIALRRAPRS